MPEIALKEAAQERQPWVHFHWQNLNDRKGGGQGSGLRHGRCWWHFRSRNRRPGPSVGFSWNLWTHFCGIGFDINDEDLTLHASFPPIAFWLSFGTNFWIIDKLAPKKVLDPVHYPSTIVVDERTCDIRIHSGSVWIHPWSKTMETVMADPWWVRGVSFSINPFEWTFQKHEVRRADGSWSVADGYWSHGKNRLVTYDGVDGREVFTAPYRYVLKDGTVQDRTATFCVERREWRPRCLQWTATFAKVHTTIDVNFDDEVGERTGSWKGGCTGCGWELRPGESPEQALRRMERERQF